jgi:hypothetical protein
LIGRCVHRGKERTTALGAGDLCPA